MFYLLCFIVRNYLFTCLPVFSVIFQNKIVSSKYISCIVIFLILETKFLHNFAVLFFLPSQVEFCLISGMLYATELSFLASAIKVDCSLLLAWNERIRSRAKVDDLGSSRGICLIFLALVTTSCSKVDDIMKQKASKRTSEFLPKEYTIYTYLRKIS